MLIFANIIQEAFSPLITLFESILVFVHDHVVGGSWGLAIVGLTVIVRAVMVPLTLRQLRSMQKLQALAPQLKEIQAKYKEDKQRQSEEVMKFYRENGVNPFGACLPLLLQLPVFISLFYALRENLKIDICGEELKRHFNVLSTSQIPSAKLQSIGCNQVAPHSAKFLFLPDITVQATGVALAVLIVLYVGSQLASTLMMSATAPAGSKGMMLALPFVFVLFIFRFPAGLLVYWITTNLWTVAQQYFVRRSIGAPPAAQPGGGPASVGPTVNGSAGSRAGGAPALAGVGGSGAAPPPPPRKKKKRSGRRR
jgi:YidC/Oxa1 family membrane protein insertase